MIDEDFKEYLQIDKHALDEELVKHPTLLFEIGEAYVEAVAERDALKEQLATTDATLDGMVRKELEITGEKATESIVKNKVQSHPLHQTASDAYLSSKLKADTLAALKEAFSTRGYMLRDLCQLYTANYFEQTSTKSSAAGDVVYHRQRQTLADARGRRE